MNSHSFDSTSFAAILFAGAIVSHASAAELYWDADGDTTAATGGPGAWSATNTWRDGSATGTLGNWADGNVSVFGGTANTVTLGSSVSMSQLKVATTNYIIGATSDVTNALSFGGTYDDTTRAIDANVANTTVRSKITGTVNGGLVVFHGSNITTPGTSGRLSLENAANDFAGDVTVLGGNLAANSSAMGNAANKLILKGGALFISGGTGTNVFNRAIHAAADSGISTNVAGSGVQVLELSGNITGSSKLTRYAAIVGSSQVKLTGDMSGYTGVFDNQLGDVLVQASAASAGKWQVTGGTLTFANPASLYGGNTALWTKENLIANNAAGVGVNVGGAGELSISQAELLFSNLTTSIDNNGLKAGSNFRLNVSTGNSVTSSNNFSNSTGTGGGSVGLTKIGGGSLTLTGSSSQTGQTYVGGGTLTFDGGSLNASSAPSANRVFNIGSGGSAEIKNNAQITLGGWMGLGYINGTGTGTLTLTDGSLTVKGVSGGNPSDRGVVIGEYTGAASTFHQNGGALTVDNTVWLGQGSAAVWNMAGGTATVKKVSFGSAAGVSGTLNLTGGTLTVGASGMAKGSGTATLNMGGGTLSSAASWSSALPMNLTGTNGSLGISTAHTITLSGALTGTGGFTKSDTGTLTLSGANSYGGATAINGGTLAITNASNLGGGQITLAAGTTLRVGGGTGTLTLVAGRTLGGSGTIDGRCVVEGTVTPGNSVGTLTVTGLLEFNPDAQTVCNVGGAWASATADKLVTTQGFKLLATPADPWVIKIQPDALIGFAESNKTFVLVEGGAPGTGFDAAAIQIDASAFTTATGTWAIQQTGNNLELVYTAGVATGFTGWASANAPGQTMDDDHDGDGVDNGIEYFMGLSGSGMTHLPAPDAGGLISWPKGAGYTGVYGTDYVIQTSTDLGVSDPWTDVPVGQVAIDADSVDFDLLPSQQAKRFARLKVTGP